MKFAYWITWSTVRLLFHTYFRGRVCNAGRVPAEGPAILAANHVSFLDPPLVGGAIRREISYLARDSLFRVPLLGAALRAWNVVPVDRDGGGGPGLKAILDRLLRGSPVVLFPEGTRARDGRLQPARAGIGLIVIKSSAPVVPVRLFGTFEAHPPHRLLPRPRPILVKFGEPLHFEALRAEARTCARPRLKAIYQQVADEIMGAIAAIEPHEDRRRFP